MADKTYIYRHRRGTNDEWKKALQIPEEGEMILELNDDRTISKFKLGDGVHTYAELPYPMIYEGSHVAQTTGDSETTVMSQAAVTKELDSLMKKKDLPGNSTGSLTNKVLIATPMNLDGTFDENFKYPDDYAKDSDDEELKKKAGQPFDKTHYAKRVTVGNGDLGIVMHSNRDQKLAEGYFRYRPANYEAYADHDEPYLRDSRDLEKGRFTIAARDERGRLVVEEGDGEFHATNRQQVDNYWAESIKYSQKTDYCELDAQGRAINHAFIGNKSNIDCSYVDNTDTSCPVYPMTLINFKANKNVGYPHAMNFNIPAYLHDKKMSVGFWLYDNISENHGTDKELRYEISLNTTGDKVNKGMGRMSYLSLETRTIAIDNSYSCVVDAKYKKWFHITITIDNSVLAEPFTYIGIGIYTIKAGQNLLFSTPVMVEGDLKWYVKHPNISYTPPVKVGTPVVDNDAVNKSYIDELMSVIEDGLDNIIAKQDEFLEVK